MRSHVLAVGIGLVCATSTMVLAQSDARANLGTTIDTFEQNFMTGNYKAMMEHLPLRLIDAVVAQTGQDRDLALLGLAAQTQTAMQGITVIEITMDLENGTIAEASSALTYALVPTVTVLDTPDGQRIRTTSTTLGLREDGAWSLSRIASPQQETAMKTLYPEISAVSLPGMTQKVMN